MSDKPFDLMEFIRPPVEDSLPDEGNVNETTDITETETSEVLDSHVQVAPVSPLTVQKVVVTELAAEKAELSVELEELKSKVSTLETEKAELLQKLTASEELIKSAESLKEQVDTLKSQLATRTQEVEDLKAAVLRRDQELMVKEDAQFEMQGRNPNALALLDRDVNLLDRFTGETRDHVLEVISEAREKAEQEGRRRRAQLLESVLVANEPSGNLKKRREAFEKYMNDHANILSGEVLEELKKAGLSYKEGDNYLLVKDILTRNY